MVRRTVVLCRGGPMWHWCQLKEVSSPKLRTRVPSPLWGKVRKGGSGRLQYCRTPPHPVPLPQGERGPSVVLCRGGPTWHWCQVKVFSPTLRLRVPSPLAGEGQGEGVYGSTAAAHYPPS